MIEHISTGALLMDASMRLLQLNAAAEALLELSAKQGENCRLTELWPGGEILESLARRAQTGGGAVTERELEVRLPSARTVTLDCTATPIADAGNIDAHYQGRVVVLELIQVDRSLRISRDERLVSQNEIARNVIRGLAHEIRNPLGGIRGAAQLLERELSAPEFREYTSVIIGEADRLQRLVDRLLGPRTVPEFRALNVHQVTERVVALLQAEVPPGVLVNRDYDPSLPDLTGDSELLIQALLNVARNAAQAVGTNGWIEFRTRIDRNCTIGSTHHRMAVRIEIADSGAGVPEELVDSLFYPLVTGRSEGTGLGLSIAQSLVHQHGGIIEHRRDHETVFSVLLPLGEQDD